ncbi:hypothetical protein QAD02_010507 [Eretmocerus hayati]|uniref:Uncharacterized protein n=1 Tax=Eretmocerus hayati TaxID=131215 RepID=A0ACC2NU83_9HYME|nr:hypothetical protein QAD02_010507 [Eretmocerus hayati]
MLYKTKTRLSKITDITVDRIMNANYFNDIRTVLNFMLVDLVDPIQKAMEKPINQLTQKTAAIINKKNLIARLPLDVITDYELTSTCGDAPAHDTGPELDPRCDLLVRRKKRNNPKG